MSQPTLINLHSNEYSHKLRYYAFAVNLDRCVGSCNTLDDLPSKACVSNETEYLSLQAFNMVTGINESKTLTKHVSCKCECKFNGRKCNLNQKCTNGKCWCNCKNPKEHCVCEKVVCGILQHVPPKMVNMQKVLLVI